MDVKFWAKENFNLDLDDWQEKFIKDSKDSIILKMGRKCGKTTAMALKIVYESNNPEWRILILSRGQRQSSEVFDTVRSMLHKIGCEVVYESRTKIQLLNGYTVYSLPSGYTAVTIRTYSFHKIYYDEAAYIPDDVYDATTPCLAVHGIQKIIASTPAGTSGFFYNEWHNIDFKRYMMKTTQCERVTKQFLLKERKRMTKAQFQQEYEAEFTELADGLISSQLIHACMHQIDWSDIKKGIVFLGIDFARFGEDDNVIAFAHYYNEKLRIKVEVHKGRHRLTSIVGRIKAIMSELPNVRKIVTDEGGLGGGPTDMLTEHFGRRTVIGISNQKRSDAVEQGRVAKYVKQDLYTNLIRKMEEGHIELDDDIDILRSLRQVKYKYTMDGLLSIYGKGSHIAEAIVRAIFPLMKSKPKRIFVDFVNTDSKFIEAEIN